MSDYVRQNDFSVKDALPSGSAQKIIKGTDVDAEFDAIVTAIASKLDNISAATNGNVPVIGSSGATLTDSGYDIYSFRTGYYNVLSYNAVGDSTTDDTAEIQAAITDAEAAGGGTVYFPSGVYLISSALVVPSKVRLVGLGISSVIYATTDINMVETPGVTSTTYVDIEIIGLYFKRRIAAARPTKYHLLMTNAARCLIRDCYIDETQTAVTVPTSYDIGGIYFAEDGAESYINWVDRCVIYGHIRLDGSDTKITGNYIYGLGSNCCLYVNGSGNSVIGNDISIGPVLGNIYITVNGFSTHINANNIDGGVAAQPPSTGIFNDGAYGINIDANLFYFLKRDAVVLNDCQFCRVTNNVFENCHYSQRTAVRAAVNCYAVKINNAAGYGTGSGVTMTVDALPEPLWIGDIVTFTGGGVLTLTAKASLSATSITGDLATADVADNELGYKITSDIIVSADDVASNSNQVIGNQMYLQNTDIEQEVFSVREMSRGSATVGANQYHNNRVNDTVTAPDVAYRADSFTISNANSRRRGNVGHGSDSYASGQNAIPIGSTHAGGPGEEYAHGLSYTPAVNDIHVNFATELASAGVVDWWISAVTDTYFRISFDAAPSAQINCYWSIDTP